MAKFGKEVYFIFDKKIFILINNYSIFMKYRIDDYYTFLSFLIETGEFEKRSGFGRNNKRIDKWLERFKWKEMEKEDENQIAQFHGKEK